MENNKQTAVEWYIDELKQWDLKYIEANGKISKYVYETTKIYLQEQAKEMEKQQSLRDYSHGAKDAITDINSVDCNRYYNQEYANET